MSLDRLLSFVISTMCATLFAWLGYVVGRRMVIAAFVVSMMSLILFMVLDHRESHPRIKP